ncbi:mammalian cell entry protein [Mycobacterium intermedium]|uniref:Mammalian cell entry protein n=1 Tax=Mycobacterium intermedium TaxID=28445 RepID=A0A1E3S7Z9_MYCIE|nr:virulence factor Mce family protein [Mycobacterium intermedium]MCV6966106.1 virulence factor Mce family protein [Mycobacterium intermedium]ODQ98230.1 mammalian cell entry protein [Mycobacterium intermedium]OPE50192.1 mammalian cell entry protein [Mycobacterium intermedium]ORA96879.1 mammalian cell entry protein [Mycobacterium intermedium]
MSRGRRALLVVLVFSLVPVMLTSCNWRGIANVPLPVGRGTGSDRMTIYVQMPDTLALNANSRVRVADVWVGTVRNIALKSDPNLKKWMAILTLDLDPTVKLPVNTTAKIGQTSLLGTQHVELVVPKDRAQQDLKSGDTITLKNSSAYPTVERTLASVAVILNGGGIPNLEVIQREILAVLDGHVDHIREFLTRLDTFVTELNRQSGGITRAIDSTNQLLAAIADRNETLDKVLTEIPPLIEHFADTRTLFADATESLGRFSDTANQALAQSRANLYRNLASLQRPLRELGRAAPYVVDGLRLGLTAPFNIDGVDKVIRGDFINISAAFDLTLSTIDNTALSGTGWSGMLRALEQAWGRDPETMIPDVRYTPNPNNAPGGPLVERAE